MFYSSSRRTSTSEVTLLDASAALPRVIQIAALAVVDVERRLVPTLIFCYFSRLFRTVKNTEEKKQRHGQVGHGRRLNSCFCRKAFKEIGRESNSTDDDDDAAVEAPAVEAPTSTSSTSSTKKKALPVFALDFGNGA